MIKPTIDLYIKNGKVQFRLSRIGSPKFHDYLNVFKIWFPEMQWHKQERKWELPVEMFQLLYEISRQVFGPKNIKLHYPDYKTSLKPIQLSIFDKD